jgi:glutamate--cysteine ligase
MRRSPRNDRSDVTFSRRQRVEHLFRPGRFGRIGVEVELIPTFPNGSAVPPAHLAPALDTAFRVAARPSFEPGGQLELSPGPWPSVAALVDGLQPMLARATELAAERGVTLLASGTDPIRSCEQVPLRLRTPRYLAMQRSFDRYGPDGRRMMRLSASLQVAVDLEPGRAGIEQWLVANLAGPSLAAAFANSPWLDGRPSEVPGSRTRIWQGVDPARTGYDGRHLDLADPIGAYAAFAAAAPRLPIPESTRDDYHLGTLFPPVRPRGGYLEVRYLDAQPLDRIGEVVTVVAALLLDPVARREALELLRPRLDSMTEQWSAASRCAVADMSEVLDIAAAGSRRLPSGYLGRVEVPS